MRDLLEHEMRNGRTAPIAGVYQKVLTDVSRAKGLPIHDSLPCSSESRRNHIAGDERTEIANCGCCAQLSLALNFSVMWSAPYGAMT
jgi:hypothetical protein